MIRESTLKLVEFFEGKRKTAYEDVAGKKTIGVGHLIKLPQEEPYLTSTLTDPEIYEQLHFDLLQVEHCINTHVTISLNQNQFDSLASFIFNLGCGNLKTSTLLKRINGGGTMDEITAEWLKWCHAGGKIVEGLRTRRQNEVNLYFASVN